MENAANRIALTGALDTLPEYSHTNHDRKFYRLMLAVERLSGAVDLLPVLAAEDVLEQADLFCGERIAVTGQLRSFNNRAPEGRRLIISVYRRTPLGREICDVMLAVPRPYRRTDYIPCILWGKNAQEAADALPGAKLRVTGRLQSRDYVKVVDGVSQTRTAYELSVTQAEFPDAPDFLEETAAFF